MKQSTRPVVALASVVALCLLYTPLHAQEKSAGESSAKPTRVALTQPPEGDWDFELMGEFVGLITVADNQVEPLGLQLRPLGANSFEALQFIGGLPGQEGFQNKTLSLVGRRFEDYMVLSGGPWAIMVERKHCLILDRQGKSVGRLERIERGSPTMGARPPAGAIVLFDGTGTDQFLNGKMSEDGFLMAGADVKPMIQDFYLHLEFRLPFMPNSDDQARGNSGCYLHSRYEVQILDSFAQLPKFNGASSLYRTRSPDLNMSFPPLVWQTYDISFTAPRWAADASKIHGARLTVWHNGVKTQDDVEIPNKTGAGQEEAPSLLPIRLQDHRDPVVFRNIWIVDRGITQAIAFPVLSPTPEELAAEEALTAQKAAQAAETAAAKELADQAASVDQSAAEPTPTEPTAPVASPAQPAQP